MRVELLEKEQGTESQPTVYVDPKQMEELGISQNDMIEITGRRKTIASWMSSFSPGTATEPGTIRMNALSRNNAEIRLSERVTIRKVGSAPLLAEGVTLLALNKMPRNYSKRQILTSSNRIPFMIGDYFVSGSYYGGKQIYQVLDFSTDAGSITQSDKMASDIPGQSNERSPSYIDYWKTKNITVVDSLPHSFDRSEDFAGHLQEMRRFAAFWVDVGIGNRIDHLFQKFLALTLFLAHVEGHIIVDFEVKTKKKSVQDSLEHAKKMLGPAAGMMGDITKMVNPHILDSFSELGEIKTGSELYIEEAAKIVEHANEENITRTLAPEEVASRILERWLQLA